MMMKLETIDYRAADAAERFVESLRSTGFGVLRNHPISQQLVQDIYRDWQEFFNSEEKQAFMFKPETQDGFFPASISETAKGHTVKDIKEYFHVYPWGRIPEQLQDNILTYYQEANALAAELLDWVEAHSPAEVAANYRTELSQMIANSHKTLLRVLHYPPMTGDETPGAIRAAAHEDINLLTVLPAANEPGLQVQSLDGEWLDVPSDFGNLIINIGDMLQEASAGYFPSTTHRVINPEGADMSKSRISLPLFLHPRPDVVLSERYTADSYLMERLRELGVI
ncbi:MAG: 2OG-Fe(II) oxygenase [Shewanella sp.]|nr:2OG-Fe(II) oxygenase [Shewanella sp.]